MEGMPTVQLYIVSLTETNRALSIFHVIFPLFPLLSIALNVNLRLICIMPFLPILNLG